MFSVGKYYTNMDKKKKCVYGKQIVEGRYSANASGRKIHLGLIC
jgi:hypothetical protein